MTKEALDKLPPKARETLNKYKSIITQSNTEIATSYKERLKGYITALKDAGVISEVENRALYIYFTLGAEDKQEREKRVENRRSEQMMIERLNPSEVE